MSTRSTLLVTGATFEKRKTKAQELLGLPSGPDFLLLESAEESLGVEKVREIKRYLATKPTSGSHKLVLIAQAEKLTVAAQNALLKTLEEPPEQAAIALLCPDSALLLPTIVSRCHLVELPLEITVELKKEEEKELEALAQALPSYSVGQKLKLASLLAKGKDSQAWLNQLLVVLHKNLRQSPKPEAVAPPLRHVMEARSYLLANTNLRLTLENLFLNW